MCSGGSLDPPSDWRIRKAGLKTRLYVSVKTAQSDIKKMSGRTSSSGVHSQYRKRMA